MTVQRSTLAQGGRKRGLSRDWLRVELHIRGAMACMIIVEYEALLQTLTDPSGAVKRTID